MKSRGPQHLKIRAPSQSRGKVRRNRTRVVPPRSTILATRVCDATFLRFHLWTNGEAFARLIRSNHFGRASPPHVPADRLTQCSAVPGNQAYARTTPTHIYPTTAPHVRCMFANNLPHLNRAHNLRRLSRPRIGRSAGCQNSSARSHLAQTQLARTPMRPSKPWKWSIP